MDHITSCQAYAERYHADQDDECLKPDVEWARLQREQDEETGEEAEPVPVPDGGAAARRRAGKRAENIRKAGGFIVEQYGQAVLEKDWDVMGYASVEEWRETEFSGFRLTVEARAGTAWLMLEGGQSVPEIAAATGVDESTIRRDLTVPPSGDSSGISAEASPSATVSDTSQVSGPPKAPEPPGDVTHVTPPEPRKAPPGRPKPATVRKQRQRARQQAAKGKPDDLFPEPEADVSAGSTPNGSKAAEDCECVCASCGNRHRKGEN